MIEVSYKLKCDICCFEMSAEFYKLPNLCPLPIPSKMMGLKFRDLFLCDHCFLDECRKIIERAEEDRDQAIIDYDQRNEK